MTANDALGRDGEGARATSRPLRRGRPPVARSSVDGGNVAREVATDRELVAAHLAEDTQAFNEIIRRHRVALWVVALRVLGDHDDAQDAVQMALLRAFRSAGTYRGDAEVLAWLRSIVENVSKTLTRTRDRGGREVVGLPPEADSKASGAPNGPEQTVMLLADAEELLGRLEDPFRRTFILVKLRGFSYAEAAAIEQVPVGTIRSRVARAKATLSRPSADS
jgi:RNA polymerase sigma-70 factor (ECF subfamily)